MIEQLKSAVFWIALLSGCLYLMSPVANSTPKQYDAAYVTALEKIVDACVSDSTGRPIKIDDGWFLCGIQPLGSFK